MLLGSLSLGVHMSLKVAGQAQLHQSQVQSKSQRVQIIIFPQCNQLFVSPERGRKMRSSKEMF